MTARILDGKRIADSLLEELRLRVDARVAAGLACPYRLEPELLLQGLQRYFADAGINWADAPSAPEC